MLHRRRARGYETLPHRSKAVIHIAMSEGRAGGRRVLPG
jgi:hypothetical protein